MPSFPFLQHSLCMDELSLSTKCVLSTCSLARRRSKRQKHSQSAPRECGLQEQRRDGKNSLRLTWGVLLGPLGSW